MAKRDAFTLKDHRPNFNNALTCQLINPTKSEIGRIRKEILQKIVKSVATSTNVNLWRSTQSVLGGWIGFRIDGFCLKKSARIVDLCCKSSGFTDFENTADRASAVIFEADSGLCLSYVRTLGPKRNLNHKSFFSFELYVHEFIQIISFFERSSF